MFVLIGLVLMLLVGVFVLLSRLKLNFQRKMRANYNLLEMVGSSIYILIMVVAIAGYLYQEWQK